MKLPKILIAPGLAFTHAAAPVPDFKTPGQRLEIEIRYDAEGRAVLHFPFMSNSDIHWGWRMSRAKRHCQMMEHTSCDVFDLVGDGVDGQALIKKQRWNMGPYHRQGMAHVLRKADNGTDVHYEIGNHECGLENGGAVVSYDANTHEEKLINVEGRTWHHRNLTRLKNGIYGVKFHEKRYYIDPNGDVVEIEHGHKQDIKLFDKPKDKALSWHGVIDTLTDIGNNFDEIARDVLSNEDFSVIAHVKNIFHETINGRLSMRKAMRDNLSANPLVRRKIYGHSHMAGFERTENGKILMNDGCSTDHVQALVHDKNGMWALLTWHKDRMDVQQEDGQKYTVYWETLGAEKGVDLSHFSAPPRNIEDEYTARADRLLRLIYRQWPPKERKIIREALENNEIFLETIQRMLDAGEDIPSQYLHQAFEVAQKIAEYHSLPVPRRPSPVKEMDLAAA